MTKSIINKLDIEKLNIKINTINIQKKVKDTYLKFKINNYYEFNEYKILITSDEDKLIQFKINCKLVKKIVIKYKENELIYDKILHNGLLINCEINKNTILEIIVFPLGIVTRLNIWEFKVLEDNPLQNILWDKIYIINLKRRNDRKIIMIHKLAEEKIDNYEFIEAYDGKDPEILENYNLLKKYTKITSSGHFGCLLSHIKAIKKAKKNNYNNIMILEDDIIFNTNFLEEIKNIKLPNYDILYLGGLINEKKVFLNGWGKVYNIMGAYAYIINKSMYDILLKRLQEFKDCVDISYYKLKDNFNIYILNDLIKTNLDSSDTSKKKNKLIEMINIINE